MLVTCHYSYRSITDYPASVPLGPLTIRAWQAAQQGLNGDETGTRILFDEIRTPINEIDRLSFPVQGEEEKGSRLYKTQMPWEELLSARGTGTRQIAPFIGRIRAGLNEGLGQLAGGIHDNAVGIASVVSSTPERSHPR